MEQHDSSNSGADEYFQKLGLKKVNIEGQLSDSGEDSHSSQSNYKGSNKVKRNNYSKQISNLLKQQQDENGVQDQKTKLIKKNCVSAKMSRQRKKIYIQLLEKKVQNLKQNIINTRDKLKVNRSKIMNYIQESNKQKKVYIQQKMKDSKRLINMSEEFTALSNTVKNIQYDKKKAQMEGVVYIPQQDAHNYFNNLPQNLQPNQIPPPMIIPSNSEGMLSENKQKQQRNLVNNKKSKRTLKNKPQPEPEHVLKQLQQKKQLLELGINSYLYKFGINGILKNDVVQLLKQKWYQLVIDESILDSGKSNELEKVICDFRDCFWQIDQSNKKLDYLLRQLRDKIKPQYVVKFILQKQFFKSFSSAQTLQSQSQSQPQISQQKMQNQQDPAADDEKQSYQYQPSKIQTKNKYNKIQNFSQSYPYESDSITKKYKKSNRKNQNCQIKRQSNQLDFDLEL